MKNFLPYNIFHNVVYGIIDLEYSSVNLNNTTFLLLLFKIISKAFWIPQQEKIEKDYLTKQMLVIWLWSWFYVDMALQKKIAHFSRNLYPLWVHIWFGGRKQDLEFQGFTFIATDFLHNIGQDFLKNKYFIPKHLNIAIQAQLPENLTCFETRYNFC